MSGIVKGDALEWIVDALYHVRKEATLFGDSPYTTSKVGFDRRDVKRQEWVI